MKRRSTWFALALSAGFAGTARAQTLDDDVKQSLMPIVVIAVDTSGSMQFRNAAERSGVAACELNVGEKSRFITALEILTGAYNGYALKFCDGTAVTGGNYNTHAQRDFPHAASSTDCLAGCYIPSGTSQGTGLIDTYANSVKFVLATFDNAKDAGTSEQSGFSYNSGDSFLWYDAWQSQQRTGNVGIRAQQECSAEGDCGPECTGACCIAGAGYCADKRGRMIPPGDAGANVANINAAIQTALPLVTPYGGTSLAPMIEDLRYWFANDPQVKTGGVDQFAQCRRKYVVLVTDGLSNMACGYTANTVGQAARCQNYTPLPCSPFPAACEGDAGFEGTKCSAACGGNACYECPAGTTCDQASGVCKDGLFDLYTPSSWIGVQNWPKPTSPTEYRDPAKIPVFVVGFDLDTTTPCTVATEATDCAVGQKCNPTTLKCRAATLVDDIAVALNTDCDADAGGTQACRATDPDIMQKLTSLINTVAAGRTSRTRSAATSRTSIPEFNGNDACPDPAKVLYKFFASFQVPEQAIHWKGFLERITTSYDPADPLHTPQVASTVCPSTCSGSPGQTNFHDLLNQDPDPKYVNDAGTLTTYNRRIYSVNSSGNVVPLDDTNFTPASLNAAGEPERNQILSCIWGKSFGSGGNLGECKERMPSFNGHRLAGIWHSSPAVVGAPNLDLLSGGYNTFKGSAGVKDRPTMVYFGTMAGTLHAFNAHSGREEWVFAPPSLLKKLKTQLTTAWAGMDGTVTVRDVQLFKKGNDDPDCPTDTTTTSEMFGYSTNMELCRWRTILVACFRRGFEGVSTGNPAAGHGCFALDVTKPTDTTWAVGGAPFSFLWEMNDKTLSDGTLHDRIGLTTGDPLLGTVFVNTGTSTSDAPLEGTSKAYDSVNNNQREVAVAVIPGGKPDGNAVDGGANNGRDYWVVELMKRGSDTETRPTVIKRIELDGGAAFDHRATGSCLGLHDQPGTRLTSAYCGLSTGHVARLNFSSSNPKAADQNQGWVVNAGWFDAFDGGGIPRQPIYDAPAGAIDTSGKLNLVFGTGNPDDLEDPSQNRLLMVKVDVSTGATTTTKAINFDAGEKVIGTPVIYNDVAYLTTFAAETTTACVFGQSTIYGFQYDSVNVCGTLQPRLADPLSTVCQSDSACSASTGYTCDFTSATCGPPPDPSGTCRRLKQPLGAGTFAMGIDLEPVPATCSASVDPQTQQLTGVSNYVPGGVKIVVQTGAVPSSIYSAPPTGQGGPTANVLEFTPGATAWLMQSRISSWGAVIR